MRLTSPDEVRAAFATHMLGSAPASATLGRIVLHAHQREGVARLQRLLRVVGGAILADDVGLGKTYVALAIANRYPTAAVIAPAALRDRWKAASRITGVNLAVLSLESFSRAQTEQQDTQLVVIDEAHHLRTPTTRRFRAVRAFCQDAKVLLVTATPIQNRVRDLQAIASLFLGERAYALSSDQLSCLIVRRDAASLSVPEGLQLPMALPPRWLDAIADVDCLDRVLALPPPVPPVDGDDGGVLLTYTLVRQWASSRAALVGALRRRLARGAAMDDVLSAGKRPARAELAAWTYADGAQQLAFPELMVGDTSAISTSALLAQLRRHVDAVRELLAWLGVHSDPDSQRAAILLDLVKRHPGERIVAFSAFADTIAALYRLLVSRSRVAMLTHSGGRVAGGALGRQEVLARFAPAVAACSPVDRIDLLLTTDVLSEGIDLQGASVVVHLDLHWNPARLEQRVGRLRRIGAARDVVSVYAFAPPAPAERLLDLERRLRVKTAIAARTVGSAGSILPNLVPADLEDSPARCDERIATLLGAWRSSRTVGDAVAGAARSSRRAALACVRIDGLPRLVAVLEDRITESRDVIEDLVAQAAGTEVAVDAASVRATEARVLRWLRIRAVADVIDLPALRTAKARHRVLSRVDAIARRTPRHVQPSLAPLVQAARSAARVTLSAGAEAVLEELAGAPLEDAAWLHTVSEFAALHARGSDAPAAILALLLLRPN